MSDKLILVGVDGSEQSRRALSWALTEAKSRGATVQVVTTWFGDGADTAGAAAQPVHQEALERQEAVVAAALADMDDPPPVLREIVRGEPVQVLCDASRDAELIVLGSHGMSQIRNVMLGSVTLGCIRFAHCPVVVIPVPYPTDQASGSGEGTPAEE